MAGWADVEREALVLPETAEGESRGLRQWQVKGKAFVWDRPLRPREIEALGDAAPDGPILAAWVEDLGVKEAMLNDDPETYFTTSHFDNYAIVLARLERLGAEELRELVVEAWLARAPKRLAKTYADSALED
ncbi:MAG TPA: MmcQ/YjbR family DNA-binding protein [Solirubrobacterales bacterium]|nr:MmcQ/YjbR family DNA-binding protein [Solirubrobacterales bacterium]